MQSVIGNIDLNKVFETVNQAQQKFMGEAIKQRSSRQSIRPVTAR